VAGYEWLAVAYLLGLTLAAWVSRIETVRRLRVSAIALAVLVLIVTVALTAPPTVRAWAPHAYLIAGYWLPAMLVTAQPASRFEEWLAATDNRIRRFLPPVPEPLRQVVELAYLFCYPLVPLSFSVVWTMGDEADVARFWLAVLLAGYSCYGTLPWLVSRPPRLRATLRSEGSDTLARLNEQVLQRVSHQLNTFPSGHVAVAAAAAAAVAVVSAPAGLIIGTTVGAISVGAAAGGYHYALDVLLGLALAAAAAMVAGVI